MIFKYFIISLVFLFFGNELLVAENAGEYTISKDSSYRFCYNPVEDASINNFFIKEIALLNFLRLKQTEYTLDYELGIDVRMGQGNAVEVKSRLLSAHMEGDIFYKGFDLTDVLLPSLYSFEILVYNGEQVVENIALGDLMASELNEVSLIGAYPEMGTELSFEVVNLKFSYLEVDKTTFKVRIADIHDMMALGELSVYHVNNAEAMDIEDREALLANYFRIYDFERYLTIVNDKLNVHSLEVPAEREEFINSNLTKLNSHQRRLNTLFTITLNSSLPLIDEAVMTHAAEVLTGLQLSYFDELSRQSFYYEPVYQELAGFFVGGQSYEMLTDSLNAYFHFSKPAQSSSENIGETFNSILLARYSQIADSLIQIEKFHEALIMLRSADAVCDATNNGDCVVEIYNKISTSKWGIYDAYIRVAQSALETANLDMALEYLELASGFQAANQGFITTDGFTLVEFEKLAWAYFQQGESEIKSELYINAMASYTHALDIYALLGILDYEEVIFKKITRLKQLIVQASVESEGRFE